MECLAQLPDEEVLIPDAECVEVEMKINGVDVDFKDAIACIHSQLNRMIREEAEELIDQQIERRLSRLNEAIDKAVSNVRGLLKDDLCEGEETEMMDQEEYARKGGDCCPFCESEDFFTSPPRFIEKHCYIPHECQSCGGEWDDVYMIIGFGTR